MAGRDGVDQGREHVTELLGEQVREDVLAQVDCEPRRLRDLDDALDLVREIAADRLSNRRHRCPLSDQIRGTR